MQDTLAMRNTMGTGCGGDSWDCAHHLLVLAMGPAMGQGLGLRECWLGGGKPV